MTERQQVISRFSGMSIDMDYLLCVPSIHAKYEDENVIISYGGGIKDKTSGFPEDKIALLKEWIMLHQDEILENHFKCGRNEYPLNTIAPLKVEGQDEEPAEMHDSAVKNTSSKNQGRYEI